MPENFLARVSVGRNTVSTAENVGIRLGVRRSTLSRVLILEVDAASRS